MFFFFDRRCQNHLQNLKILALDGHVQGDSIETFEKLCTLD